MGVPFWTLYELKTCCNCLLGYILIKCVETFEEHCLALNWVHLLSPVGIPRQLEWFVIASHLERTGHHFKVRHLGIGRMRVGELHAISS